MTQDAPGRRILLVEDEGMIAMLIEDMLGDLGHELVRVANRLEDAIAAARNESIDLAILDLNLSGVLTYPAADVLMERGIPFIFATGYGSAGRLWADHQSPRHLLASEGQSRKELLR